MLTTVPLQGEKPMRKRVRASHKVVAALLTSALVLSACGDDEKEDGGSATTAGGGTQTTAGGGGDDPLAALYQECLDNGAKVNLIALPDEWANYKGILQAFRDKYPGVENPVADPDASSADEMEAVETLKGQDNMPDNVDVSPAIAQEMVDKGLFEPYVLTTDAEIPAGLKDADNNWTAAYYGIMAIATNTTIVPNAPKTFADLTKPEYEGLVALNGDPRESGAAFAAVMAASIANGGSADDIMPGIEFFAALKESGNLGATDVTKETVLSGETPIAIDWSYNIPGLRADLEAAGLTVEVNFPSDGIYGGFYGQGVVKDSPHQACSKLWMEHIFSDEGALGYLEGGAVPARIEAITAAGLVTDEMKVNLPPDELLGQVAFLTPAQIAAAKETLAESWGPMVADA
ncbi:MAG TPA: ABC transporter substrate-binding protein [Acidimicrobiaceae bacterium]|nr:ABC transporter substrate-binding protein [Acidimicrobiaceae bacterium]